jgi:peptidoglycan/LPS O-acetylase OafA/YrhL
LRGLAACAVVLYHYTSAFDEPSNFPGYPLALFDFKAGRYGVQLFFVISGFVILMTTGRVKGVGDFAYARFSRLYPPYWASMLFVSAYILVAQNLFDANIDRLTFTFPQFLANLTMVPKWFLWADYTEIDGVYWSLAIEMGFYLMVAVMIALGLTKRSKILPTLVVVWAFDGLFNGIRFLSGLSTGDRGPFTGDYTHLFVAGMALYLLFSQRDRSNREKWILRILIFSAPIFDAMRFEEVAAVLTLVIVVLVYVAVFHGLPMAETSPAQWLGRMSYSLYLVHAYPGYITMKMLMDHGWGRNLAVLVAIAQSFLLAMALHYSVEVPVTRWLRDRRRTRPPKLSDTDTASQAA